MKKLLCAVLILSAVFAAYAEIDKPNRFIEFGVEGDVMFDNSYLAIGDILTPEIVIDFDEMLESATDGLRVGANPKMSAFTNFYFGQAFRLTLSAGLDSNMNINLPKELIELFAEGNTLSDEAVTVSLKAGADITAEITAGFGTKIGPVAVMVTPKFFMPLVYVKDPTATYTMVTSESGTNSFSAEIDGLIYSAFDFGSFEDQDGFDAIMTAFQENFGLDVTVAAEMPIFSFLDIGVSVSNIPFKSAVLKYETTFGTTEPIEFETDSLLDDLLAAEEETATEEESGELFEMGESTEIDGVSFSRKIKVGLTAAWRPFNNQLISLVPSMVFKFDSLDAISVEAFETSKFDYGIKADVRLLKNFLGLNFATFCEDEIWTNKIGLMLNIRLIEVDVNVYTQGYTFIDSFMGGNGFGIGTAVKVGI